MASTAGTIIVWSFPASFVMDSGSSSFDGFLPPPVPPEPAIPAAPKRSHKKGGGTIVAESADEKTPSRSTIPAPFPSGAMRLGMLLLHRFLDPTVAFSVDPAKPKPSAPPFASAMSAFNLAHSELPQHSQPLLLSVGTTTGAVLLFSCTIVDSVCTWVHLATVPPPAGLAVPVSAIRNHTNLARVSESKSEDSNDPSIGVNVVACRTGDILALTIKPTELASPATGPAASSACFTIKTAGSANAVAFELNSVLRRNAHSAPICAFDFIPAHADTHVESETNDSQGSAAQSSTDVVNLETDASLVVADSGATAPTTLVQSDAAFTSRSGKAPRLLTSSLDGTLHVWQLPHLQRCAEPAFVSAILDRSTHIAGPGAAGAVGMCATS